MVFKQVAFNANRFAVCFNGLYTPGIQNDCIVMSGGTADRGDLAVLRKEIPTGSGVHRLLPNLGNAGKCVNIIPLKDSQQIQVSVFHVPFIECKFFLFFPKEITLVIRRDILNHSPFHKVYFFIALSVLSISCCQIEQIELGNFGSQAILAIKTYPGYTNVDVVSTIFRETCMI